MFMFPRRRWKCFLHLSLQKTHFTLNGSMEKTSADPIRAQKSNIENTDPFIIQYNLFNGVWIIFSYQVERDVTVWDRFLKADAKEISVRTNVSLITFLLVLEIRLHNKNVKVDKTEIQPEMEWELALGMGSIMVMCEFISLFLFTWLTSPLLSSFLIK